MWKGIYLIILILYWLWAGWFVFSELNLINKSYESKNDWKDFLFCFILGGIMIPLREFIIPLALWIWYNYDRIKNRRFDRNNEKNHL